MKSTITYQRARTHTPSTCYGMSEDPFTAPCRDPTCVYLVMERSGKFVAYYWPNSRSDYVIAYGVYHCQNNSVFQHQTSFGRLFLAMLHHFLTIRISVLEQQKAGIPELAPSRLQDNIVVVRRYHAAALQGRVKKRFVTAYVFHTFVLKCCYAVYL